MIFAHYRRGYGWCVIFRVESVYYSEKNVIRAYRIPMIAVSVYLIDHLLFGGGGLSNFDCKEGMDEQGIYRTRLTHDFSTMRGTGCTVLPSVLRG